ncbi:uncharacterized protein LOC112343542 [Selaginella moellendorffii]|uniref:uncharacterized protein LOC112343542 n=1 Tax=Selaginella moellendorffii TaxID=88036 RepID=UPI000D1C9038|nr:uncharacterized protein LOC112343542 [Selaginella moellendorffii]XP_024522944.1 uncharacterized protein LOC112343542 [Selaginella moellendorffii]|eukprot:XP_024522943.1 uncharacterized protein LOC112343542 [Selaginella moellendorffii]
MALASSISKVLERFKRNPRAAITDSGKSREKARISFPRLEFRERDEAKFDLVARLDLTLRISMLSKVNSEIQRRSFSALLLFTAVCLIGPSAALAMEVDDIPEYGPGLPKKDLVFHGGVFLARVQRPMALSTTATSLASESSRGVFMEEKLDVENEEEELEEILELSMVVPRSELTAFDVFINLPQASESSPITLPEFVGSFASGEIDRPGYRRVKVRFGIGDKIKLLHLEKERSVLVAIVRHGATKGVEITIKDIDIELE